MNVFFAGKCIKVSFFYLIMCQLFIFTFCQKNDTLTLFHKKPFYV